MSWTAADEFLLSIKLGLRKGLALVRGMRRALTDEEQDRVAGAIAEHVQRAWRIESHDTPVAPGLHSKLAAKTPDRDSG